MNNEEFEKLTYETMILEKKVNNFYDNELPELMYDLQDIMMIKESKKLQNN